MKRAIDIIASFFGLVVSMPVLLPVMFLVWRQDYRSPFYVANRVGKGGIEFKMVKLRSMVVNADQTGVDSTGSNDLRITPVGHFIRKFKLDEITQLWNVLLGDMSLVGPRPNVKRETDLYTHEEKKLLSIKPGITDFASIVFSDEGEILKDKPDPDISYNQLIRPGKGFLGIYYIENQSIWLDVQLCLLTLNAIISRPTSLTRLENLLKKMGANQSIIEIAARRVPLRPMPPPGAQNIVTSRDGSL